MLNVPFDNNGKTTNEVHNAEAQVQKQIGIVEQLKRQVNDLEKNQTQTQKTLANLDNALRDAKAGQKIVEAKLKTTDE